jgi:hypothetical protein
VKKQEKQISLYLAIPTMGYVDFRFAMSLASLQVPENTQLMMSPRVMIDTSRNLIVERMLKTTSCSHLMMIDDDMIFPTDSIMKLLKHDVDVVGCLAFKRVPSYDPCVYRKKENNKYYPILPNVFQEVDVIGTSGILIKREVLEKIHFPYFETFYDKEGLDFLKGNKVSVDFDFSNKAKKAGFKIFCDPEVQFQHIGEPEIVDQTTFLTHMNKLKNEKKS